MRFFFNHTLDRPDLARKLVRTVHARKIPVVLTLGEVKRLLDATTCLKHQAALSVAYGAGLRVAEVSALKVSDVDSMPIEPVLFGRPHQDERSRTQKIDGEHAVRHPRQREGRRQDHKAWRVWAARGRSGSERQWAKPLICG